MENIILSLEHEIASYISNDNGATVHFEYRDGFILGDIPKVLAYTVNNNSKEVFLLKEVVTNSKEEGLKEILQYVKEQKGMNSFTVKWAKIGVNKIETSYFYCHDIIDVIRKFFDQKDAANYIIYEIKLNPIA